MITKTDLRILRELRKDARQPLTRLSRKTKIPVSTLFERIKSLDRNLINRYTALLNFEALGFFTKVNLTLKVDKSKRDALKSFLIKHSRVNSLYRINNGFDFMLEALFYDVKELEWFLGELDNFKGIKYRVAYVIEELQREAFMTKKVGG